jgi:hypothetical protein
MSRAKCASLHADDSTKRKLFRSAHAWSQVAVNERTGGRGAGVSNKFAIPSDKKEQQKNTEANKI